MRCADVTERVLLDEQGRDPELDRHVADCVRCARVALRVARLDSVLATTLVVEPPLELQRQLAQLVLEAARPAPAPATWRARVAGAFRQWDPAGWLVSQPQMVAVQGLAAVVLALASWQTFGWLSAVQPVVGDVGYAVELVAASPAAVYLSGLQIDVPSLALWSLVGVVGWLVSEDGFIGRLLSSRRLRLP